MNAKDALFDERHNSTTAFSAQILKTRRSDRIVKVEPRALIGAAWRFEEALKNSEDSSTINTSFIEGYSELDAQVIDDEVHTTGKGKDPGGELVEQGRYHDISGNGYSFTLDRSYDGGKTWIRPFVSFRATRRKPAE